MGAILQVQQFADFIQAEAQPLGCLHELHAPNIPFVVPTNGPERAVWLPHKASALVEANRFNIDTGRAGKRADRQIIRSTLHGFGPLLSPYLSTEVVSSLYSIARNITSRNRNLMPREETSTDASLTRSAGKVGVIGAIVAAMGCAACFPAIASLGAAIGLGFLSQFEGVFIHYLLPLFAAIGLLANLIGGLRHRQWLRMALGMVGPVLVLAAVWFMVTSGRSTPWLIYPGLVLMAAVAIWDLVSPPRNECDTNGSGPACS